jgi:transcriptional regulator with XRE-family HTH domain
MARPEQGIPFDVAHEGEYAKRLGVRLRTVRELRGWSLRDVEVQSGGRFSGSAVGSYERATRLLSVPRLHSLAEFYDVPLARLLPSDGAEPAGGGADANRGHTGRPRSADDGIVLDLVALESSRSPDYQPLRRYVETIRSQRHDDEGATLTVRGGDVAALAAISRVDAPTLIRRLRHAGLVCRTSRR